MNGMVYLEIEWEGAEKTYEPINHICETAAFHVYQYAKEKGLLCTHGWKFLSKMDLKVPTANDV